MDRDVEAAVPYVLGLLLGVVIVFISGFRLHHTGGPYGSGLLNLHKLVDLAAIVVSGVLIYRQGLAAPLAAAEWALVGLAVLFVVATLATGGVASAAASPPSWVVTLHKLTPYPAIALVGLALYVIGSRR